MEKLNTYDFNADKQRGDVLSILPMSRRSDYRKAQAYTWLVCYNSIQHVRSSISLERNMDEETQSQKVQLLAIYKDNLREIEAQIALFGMAPPIHLINQLKHHRQKIEEINLVLNSNAREISFNESIVNIEDLRKFASDEVKNAVIDYKDMIDEHRYMQVKLGGLAFLVNSGFYSLSFE